MDLSDTELVVAITSSPLNSHIHHVQRLGVFWRMRVDYPKLIQILNPTATAVLDMASLLEHNDASLTIWYWSIEQAKVFIMVPVHNDHLEAICIQLIRPAIYLYSLTLLFIHSPCFCGRFHNHLSVPPHITLACYIDDDIMSGKREHKVAAHWTVGKYVQITRWG